MDVWLSVSAFGHSASSYSNRVGYTSLPSIDPDGYANTNSINVNFNPNPNSNAIPNVDSYAYENTHHDTLADIGGGTG